MTVSVLIEQSRKKKKFNHRGNRENRGEKNENIFSVTSVSSVVKHIFPLCHLLRSSIPLTSVASVVRRKEGVMKSQMRISQTIVNKIICII